MYCLPIYVPTACSAGVVSPLMYCSSATTLHSCQMPITIMSSCQVDCTSGGFVRRTLRPRSNASDRVSADSEGCLGF